MAEGNRPDFDVFAMRERDDGGKDIFVKIGVAFKRRNADGMTIMLDALPLGRKLAVLPPPCEAHETPVRRRFFDEANDRSETLRSLDILRGVGGIRGAVPAEA